MSAQTAHTWFNALFQLAQYQQLPFWITHKNWNKTIYTKFFDGLGTKIPIHIFASNQINSLNKFVDTIPIKNQYLSIINISNVILHLKTVNQSPESYDSIND